MPRTFTWVAMLLGTALHAQNLVPNPSFEQVSSCPSFASQLDRAAPWTNPTLGTPELYHGCAPLSSYVSVPNNTTGGFQYARTGQGYAGLYTWRTDIANMREYAQVQLSAPLQAGTCYRVSMYVNMPNDQPYACDGFGAHLSAAPLTANNGQVLPVPPHIDHTAGALITDTLGWTLISGIYDATGGERYLTIGNFRNDANTQTQLIHTGTWYTTSAYLLVDDVSVEAIPLELDLGPDTLLCSNNALLLDATTPGASYLWSDGGTGPTLAVSQPGTYWVTVMLGACSISDTIVVSGGGPPRFDLPERLAICPGGSVEVDATVPGASILWMDGDTNAIRTISTATLWTVTATNACGSTTAQVDVRRDLCPCIPFLPNAFTPNGDGINDTVGPQFRCGSGEVTWSIHDRWGSLVFEGASLDVLWDGTIGGQPVVEGTYVWSARVLGTGDEHSVYMGHVTVLR
ncbi:MAG: gliding motility-associated C-terminal domain-containing protein [Flavobacteriales bacterium]|nr:gliding motility-associated C-terminal domain-containing protein [Flavobacteriales bacterium]